MKNPTKAQQIFLYVAPFPCLAFFKIWAAGGREPGALIVVTLAILGYCALIIGLAYRWDKPTYFDWAVTGYFAVASVSLLLWAEAAGMILINYATTGIYAVLFAAAFFPPLFGLDPFTYHYAKKSTPKEYWGNPIFLKINLIMTYVWAGLFAVSVGLSLYPSIVTRAFVPIGIILGFGLPFNRRYPDYYLKKLGLPSLADQRRMADEEPGEDETVSPLPLPTTAWEAVSKMPAVFNAGAAGDLSAIIGFNVSGSETFDACLEIEKGTCTLREEPTHKPDLLIRAPADVWLAIARKERDSQEAFMKRAFTAKGNLGILMRLNQIFGGAVTAKAETARGVARETADQPE